MEDRQQYIQEVERKLGEWDQKIQHVRKKAEKSGDAQSDWLQHTLEKRQQVDELLGAIRDADENTFESKKSEIAIATQELEGAMVRAAERFEEAGELGLDPESRKEIKDEKGGAGSVQSRTESEGGTDYRGSSGEVRSGSGTSKVPSVPQAGQGGTRSEERRVG